MGRPQSIHITSGGTPLVPLRRAADVVLAGLLLVALAPVMALLALLVRSTSHGPVLARRPVATADGRSAALLAFRTQVDGGATTAHERLRAVVGADHAYTPVGRYIARLRLDRLPRLVNVLRGDAGILA